MEAPLIPITQSQVEELMARQEPFVLLFSATWCGECQIAESILGRLKTPSDKTIAIYKILTEAESNFNLSLGVHRLPTLVFIKNGKVIQNIYGIRARRDIRTHINELMDNTSHHKHCKVSNHD